MKNDPVNYIDPTGELWANLISAGIGAILGGYNAYTSGGSFADVAKAALIGGASNFLTGKALFNAINGLIGNLANQVSNPCFKNINVQQALAAAILGGYAPGTRGWTPNLLSWKQVVSHEVAVQAGSDTLIRQF